MTTTNLVQAVNDALGVAMGADDDVVLLGEDIGKFGGVFRATAGLQERFGEDRVIDTPLNEAGIIGSAVGMALYGMRPVPEIQFSDFIYPGFDHIVNELAKYRYRSGGQFGCPVTIRTPVGGGIRGGHYHSQSPEAYFIHTPGLKVVCPSTPYDAKGLLLASIRSDDPVLFLEPKPIYRRATGDVPDEDYEVPLGKARVVREGDDVTLVAWGAMVPLCEEVAKRAASDGTECTIIDPRTLWPLDVDTVVDAVKATGRCVIVHEAPRTCGFGAEVASLVQERAFLYLEAPIVRVTGYDTPFPYTLERAYLPSVERVLDAIDRSIHY
ncbi:MAG: alpha-ketoacid dehydrogenase subunit beta [Myxococcota bacterium]